MKTKIIIGFLIIILFPITTINAAELENYFFQTSVLTYHYSNKDYQNNDQKLISFERHYTDQSLYGIAFFQNTYNQNTFYIYKGKNYTLLEKGFWDLTGKFTYGIIHGYKKENEDHNTWMHKMETFPGIVFGIGLKRNVFRLDLLPFANAGIIITSGIEF